jgi:hypothetical protein
VGTSVAVLVAVGVIVGVAVTVAVTVGWSVGRSVAVAVAVVVAVWVGVTVAVAVGVGSVHVTERQALPTDGSAVSRARTERTAGSMAEISVVAGKLRPCPVQSAVVQTVIKALAPVST